MESLMYRLKDTITTTVSSLNSYIPGNPVTRDYEITAHRASGGPGFVWKIYSGFKKSTKEEASIFIFDKKLLHKFAKKDRDLILDRLKKGVSQLTRLRHPSILTVSHPLEESRESLAFATEPVFASLANLLGAHENMPSPLPQDLVNYEFYDVEIKYGLLFISEALAFLHNDVKLLHRNICPEIIMVNKKGAWKLTGFDFSCPPTNPHDFPLYFPCLNINGNREDTQLTLPNLDYIAPEYLAELNSSEAKITLNSDMYSLGALTYTLYNKGKPLLPTGGNVSLFTNRRLEQYNRLPVETFNCIPEESRHHIKLLLSVDPILRPDAHQFNKLNIFEDVLVRTLQYLDSLFQWDNLQKSQFYKGLPEIMAMMPFRVKLNRVFPALAKEFVNPEMVPFVLPNVMLIIQEASGQEFIEMILPDLVVTFQMKEPVQISVILMQNMELILTKCKSNPESIKEHILPLMCRCLELESPQIQEQTLNTIPAVVHLIDASSIKNSIVPRVKKLCLATSQLSTRVNCLLCLAKLLETIDKWVVLDDIVPFLPDIPSREPPVIMAILGIYKRVLNNSRLGLSKETMATKVIPFLMPLAIENGLTVNQFNTIISLIKEMVEKVECEQRVKVEQLNSMKVDNLAVTAYKGNASMIKKEATVDDIFDQPNKAMPKSEMKEKNLSLQEKEMLAKSKEMNEVFKKQQPLISQEAKVSVTSSSNAASKPKDLTATLINSNLQNLSLSQASQTNRQSDFSSAAATMGPMYRAPLVSSPISSNSSHFQTNQSINSFPNTFRAASQMMNPSPLMQTQPQSLKAQQSNVRAQIDLSAFDKLAIPGLSQNASKPQSLNSIATKQQSPVFTAINSWPASSSSSNGESGTKLNKLSKADFDDLLS
ncbi:SCY1-like protein 2 [Dinothrombium tinctorium]|uniref:SCY1-like protein 2 n=1 Tax=Dinothrombium tinctorium TaxID=1965070 RepID=A0A3S3S1K0_9ACAR|nr:SCY1-like protein 2 [Dinothrombium tinctorium]RWS07884.1 SCY1-like protein 2 [Dinothrombium tinctorium]RWS07888.1 SCY1-like protein 2 [Dinothrombium tinctorium]